MGGLKIVRFEPFDRVDGLSARVELYGRVPKVQLDALSRAFHDDADVFVVRKTEKVGAPGSEERIANRVHRAARELNEAIEDAARHSLTSELSIVHTHVLGPGPSHERVSVRVLREL